jgi:hypothetical protein
MRRFNQESSNILPVLFIGGAVAYFWWYSQKHKKSITESVTEHIPERIPHPEYAMIVPKTQEELDTVDEALCDCYNKNKDSLGNAATEVIVTTLQLCTAKSLYSDFPWPPMSGDNPTVEKLWDIIEYRIRQLLNDAEMESLCETPLPGVEGEEAPEGPEGEEPPGEGAGEGESGEAQQGWIDQQEPQQGGVAPAPGPAYQPYSPPGGFQQPQQGQQTTGTFTSPYTQPKPPMTFKFP